MHSARKEPDRTYRTKILRISCAQVGDVQGQACHRSVYLQIFQFQLFLTTVWMLWTQLGHCQQWWKMCCLQDLVYVLLLNQLWNHCTDIVQSTKKYFGEQNNKLPYKSNFWVITRTTAMRKKNFQQFCEISFVLYLHIFSVGFFPSDRISACVMLFLLASEKQIKSRFLPQMYTALLPRFPHTDDFWHFDTQQHWNQKCYTLKAQSALPSLQAHWRDTCHFRWKVFGLSNQ